MNMGGSRRDGKASGYANALRSNQPVEGASVAPEYSERGKAAYRGKGARESTFSSTHYQHKCGEHRANRLRGRLRTGT